MSAVICRALRDYMSISKEQDLAWSTRKLTWLTLLVNKILISESVFTSFDGHSLAPWHSKVISSFQNVKVVIFGGYSLLIVWVHLAIAPQLFSRYFARSQCWTPKFREKNWAKSFDPLGLGIKRVAEQGYLSNT